MILLLLPCHLVFICHSFTLSRSQPPTNERGATSPNREDILWLDRYQARPVSKEILFFSRHGLWPGLSNHSSFLKSCSGFASVSGPGEVSFPFLAASPLGKCVVFGPGDAIVLCLPQRICLAYQMMVWFQ